MGSSPLAKKIHKAHNNTCCDLPSNFFLDEFSFKSHSEAQNGPIKKLRGKGVGIFIRHMWLFVQPLIKYQSQIVLGSIKSETRSTTYYKE